MLLCVTETAHVKRNKKHERERRQRSASVVQQISIKKKNQC
jgi:hypothetical protein